MRQQQIAELYFLQKQIEKQLKDAPELQPGEYNVGNREITFKTTADAVVIRSEGENGDGKEYKKGTPKVYGFAIIAALLHYATKPRAPQLSLKLVVEIVEYALECEVDNETAFQELHPRMAKAIKTVRETIRERLPKIPYLTPRKVDGGVTVVSRAVKKAA